MPALRFFLSKTTLTFTHGWLRRRLILTGLTQVAITTESKSVSLGWRRFETFPKEVVFFPSEYALKIHSWMVSSELIITPSRLKWYPQRNQNLSLELYQCRFETCRRRRVFLSEHGGLEAWRFVHWWFPWRSILTGPNQVVSTTEWKSVLLEMRKFKTCRWRAFFFSIGTHSTFSHGWIHWTFLSTSLSQAVITTESKSVSLRSGAQARNLLRASCFSNQDMP
jgi:hypothetical protein